MTRTILHVDLNNFFASVACLFHPEAAQKPMAVCGDAAQRQGIVLSKNQLAKNCGVKTAETIWQAKAKISAANFQQLVWPLPVGDLLYVGKATQRRLANRAIFTIGDLARRDPHSLSLLLGKSGEALWRFANGRDSDPVVPPDGVSDIKSISNSTTSPRDLTCENDVKIIFFSLAECVAARLRKRGLKGRTLAISIRNEALDVIERQAKLPAATNRSDEIAQQALRLFGANWRWNCTIRSLGVQVSDLVPVDCHNQLSLFDVEHPEADLLESTIDKIRARFGAESIQRCVMLTDRQLSSFHSKEAPFPANKAERR